MELDLVKHDMGGAVAEEVGHCMLPYIRDQTLELAKDGLAASFVITYRS